MTAPSSNLAEVVEVLDISAAQAYAFGPVGRPSGDQGRPLPVACGGVPSRITSSGCMPRRALFVAAHPRRRRRRRVTALSRSHAGEAGEGDGADGTDVRSPACLIDRVFGEIRDGLFPTTSIVLCMPFQDIGDRHRHAVLTDLPEGSPNRRAGEGQFGPSAQSADRHDRGGRDDEKRGPHRRRSSPCPCRPGGLDPQRTEKTISIRAPRCRPGGRPGGSSRGRSRRVRSATSAVPDAARPALRRRVPDRRRARVHRCLGHIPSLRRRDHAFALLTYRSVVRANIGKRTFNRVNGGKCADGSAAWWGSGPDDHRVDPQRDPGGGPGARGPRQTSGAPSPPRLAAALVVAGLFLFPRDGWGRAPGARGGRLA